MASFYWDYIKLKIYNIEPVNIDVSKHFIVTDYKSFAIVRFTVK